MTFADAVTAVGAVIDAARVAVIAIGVVVNGTVAALHLARRQPDVYIQFRRRLGRSILPGL